MHHLLPLLILAVAPPTEEAVDVYRCDFVRQAMNGVEESVDVNYDAWPDHWTRRRDRQ